MYQTSFLTYILPYIEQLFNIFLVISYLLFRSKEAPVLADASLLNGVPIFVISVG
jgi:hypothetical protein